MHGQHRRPDGRFGSTTRTAKTTPYEPSQQSRRARLPGAPRRNLKDNGGSIVLPDDPRTSNVMIRRRAEGKVERPAGEFHHCNAAERLSPARR